MGLLLALLLVASCSDVERSGIDEPLVVRGAVFVDGDLPRGDDGPTVTSITLPVGVILPGQRNRWIYGRTSGDGHTIAVRFKELGTGYWLQPMSGLDPGVPGEYVFDVYIDFGRLDGGSYVLEFVAFNEEGVAGPAQELQFCMAGTIPDNLNGCQSSLSPPAAVISLSWNQNADVDLVVVSPDGRTYNDRKPIGGADPVDPTVPFLDRDSNAGCVTDGHRRENLVLPEIPQRGTWLVYANLFDSCGVDAVAFRVDVYERVENSDGTFALEESAARSGQFLSSQANVPKFGSTDEDVPPLFLTAVELK